VIERIERRYVVATLACVAASVAFAAAGSAGGRTNRTARQARPVPAGVDDAGPTVTRPTRSTIEEHLHVRRGDTLGSLLAARGVGAREAQRWIAAASEVFDVRRLRPRRALTLRFERSTRTLVAIRYEIDSRAQLVLEGGAGGIRAQRTSLPYFVEVKGAAGVIEQGLREDALEAGVPERVVSALADIFGWDLDVANDLLAGDEFRVLYENTWQAGELDPEPGNVLGAELVTHGRRLTAVFFEDEDGRGAYYRPDGSAVSRELLRYPLEFTEITSRFSLVRRHPILRVRRPHLGVDFAAPHGTAVRAVASGVVESAGWVHQLGKTVRIEHAGGLESVYGHLRRVAAGVSAGTRVEQGQIVGYVGATGLATGPHLHFATYREGEYVDPLTLTAEMQASVPDVARSAFARVQTAVRHHLATLPLTANVTVSRSTFRALE
jgi:murein DD-endopeptidase MepM/ murein hydrolase activator NlpD